MNSEYDMNRKYEVCCGLPPLKHTDRLVILFECISWALMPEFNDHDLNEYLGGIFGEFGLCGGDPGWALELKDTVDIVEDPDQWKACVSQSKFSHLGCYQAYVWTGLTYLDIELTYYTVEEVRCYFRMALESITIEYPERANEVTNIIARYAL